MERDRNTQRQTGGQRLRDSRRWACTTTDGETEAAIEGERWALSVHAKRNRDKELEVFFVCFVLFNHGKRRAWKQ